MGKVVGESIVKRVQNQLEHFADKKFDLNYKENVHIHAPKNLSSQSVQDILFFLKSIKGIEDQLDNGPLLSKTSFKNVRYKDGEHVSVRLDQYEEVFTKKKIQVTVSLR